MNALTNAKLSNRLDMSEADKLAVASQEIEAVVSLIHSDAFQLEVITEATKRFNEVWEG
jgi:hypothetical protein